MKRIVIWVVALLVIPLLLLGAAALMLQRWVSSDDFKAFVAQRASEALGVPVELGRVQVDVWPLPAVALEQVQVRSQPPVNLGRVLARPTWSALLRRKLEVESLIVSEATVPEQAVAVIGAAVEKSANARKQQQSQPASDEAMALPQRIVLDRITWISAKGTKTTVNATASIDPDRLPGQVDVEIVEGNFRGVSASLQRQADHWAVKADVGGGTVAGRLRYVPGAAKAPSTLQGDFTTSNVEVAALTVPSRTLTGRLEAKTNLRAEFRDGGTLFDALRTQTQFTVRGAVVHGLDLAQAVRTVGVNKGGTTRLDTLAGNVATQGRAVQVNNLVASSGMLSANGNVAMAPNRSLSGRITVDLATGAVAGTLGVPLAVGGTLDSPTVTLSRGALIGAAIGTAIAPGLGTGGGAKVGDKLGESLKGLFGR